MTTVAIATQDIDLPGFRPHPFKGRDLGRWFIWVKSNWRLTFQFRDGDASVLDCEDYP
jgi:proteic killer suppression protein